MFTSRDDGQTWSTMTEGPGTVTVDELIWKDDRTLVAVTHGRGLPAAQPAYIKLPIAWVKAASHHAGKKAARQRHDGSLRSVT